MSRVALARVGVGVVVQEGGPVPDVSTPEKLKAAVLAARSLTHTDPAIPQYLRRHRRRRVCQARHP